MNGTSWYLERASNVANVLEGLFAPWHILIIGTVALLVLGPDKLPEAARQVGRAVREVGKFREYLSRDVHELLNGDDGDGPSGPSLPDASRD